MRNCGIYCITNTINGKRYVGQSINLKERFNSYIKGRIHNKHLKRSIKKYGWENFTLKVLVYSEVEDLNYYEIKLIKQWDLMDRNKGYNQTEGGEGSLGYKHTKEAKEKIRQNSLNISDKTKQKIANSLKGFKHTIETRKKLSDMKKGKKTKPVISEDGLIYFNGVREAMENGYKNICGAMKNNRPCKGMRFRFATQEEIDERCQQ